MRIISGIHKGRAIEPPQGMEIRPTSDRTREALFNLLLHGAFEIEPVVGQTVLDLCCGTGALGLEALSRGAARAIFIDNSREALKLTERNVSRMGETARAKLISADATRLPKAVAPVALVLMDAPYFSEMIVPAYDSLRAQGWIEAGAILACEQNHKEVFPELEGARQITQRHYGKTRITLMQVEA